MLAKRSAGRLSNSRIACCTSDKSVTCQYCSFPCFTFVSVIDRKSTRLNSSHDQISYAVFCLKKKKKKDVIAPSVLSRDQGTPDMVDAVSVRISIVSGTPNLRTPHGFVRQHILDRAADTTHRD